MESGGPNVLTIFVRQQRHIARAACVCMGLIPYSHGPPSEFREFSPYLASTRPAGAVFRRNQPAWESENHTSCSCRT